ncbi:hypothetical protein BH11PLA2_BH11PLA2_10330 [soil metagenome]
MIGSNARRGLLIIGIVASAGCNLGEPTGTVSGTITLDGKPVPDGLIRFVPADGNSQPGDSFITNGQYQLTMTIGDKKVEILSLKANGAAVDTASQGKGTSVQLIPEKYNVKTTLRYMIEKGTHTKDFELLSK